MKIAVSKTINRKKKQCRDHSSDEAVERKWYPHVGAKGGRDTRTAAALGAVWIQREKRTLALVGANSRDRAGLKRELLHGVSFFLSGAYMT